MEIKIKIFSGRASRNLAQKIAESLGVKLGNESVIEFADGEFEPSFDETIRGSDVFIVQSTMPPAENLMELLLMIDPTTKKRLHRSLINVLSSYFNDKVDLSRLVITAYKEKPKVRRPGVHAKTKNSNNKQSKNYVKKYRGQGR